MRAVRPIRCPSVAAGLRFVQRHSGSPVLEGRGRASLEDACMYTYRHLVDTQGSRQRRAHWAQTAKWFHIIFAVVRKNLIRVRPSSSFLLLSNYIHLIRSGHSCCSCAFLYIFCSNLIYSQWTNFIIAIICEIIFSKNVMSKLLLLTWDWMRPPGWTRVGASCPNKPISQHNTGDIGFKLPKHDCVLHLTLLVICY